MYFSVSTAFALLSAPLFALAQQSNPFNIPSEGLSFSGGQASSIKWTPTTDGTVTLVLRSGSSDNLNEGTVIASHAENSGSYSWTPSDSLTRGSDYSIEIIDDSNPENTNYTPFFVLDTTTTEEKETPEVTLGAPSQTLMTTTAKPTGDATTLTALTKEDTESTTATSEEAESPTGSTAAMTPTEDSGTPATTDFGANTPTYVTPSASGSSGSSGSSSAGPASASSGGAGARATAMGGMLGVVALGALAL